VVTLGRALPLAAIVASVAAMPAAAQVGSIRGIVYDRDFDAPLGAATIDVVGLRKRVVGNDNGNFLIPDVPAGTYTLVFSKDGYARQVRGDVIVREGQLTDVTIRLAGEFEEMEEFVVEELDLAGSEGQLLELRLQSPQLLETVGVDLINRSGAGDAAAALLLVPGATIQDGKYAVVRGLPERYVSAQLDGVRLPTADDEKRAVQLDQFPSAVLQSIQVSKTFTPDQQGDASGGAVNIELRDIPEETSFQVKVQTGFNSQAYGKGKGLSFRGGGLDFLGNNDTLDIPYDSIGESFGIPVGTDPTDNPLEYKMSFSGGGKYDLGDGSKIGAFGSFFYEQDYSYFDNGQENTLVQMAPGGPLVPLEPEPLPTDLEYTSLYDITQGTEVVQWGGLGTVGYESEHTKLGAKFLYTQLSESQAVLAIDQRGREFYFPGWNPNDNTTPGWTPGTPGDPFDPPLPEPLAPWQRNETLTYQQSSTTTFILNGEHTLSMLGGQDVSQDPTAVWGAPIVDWRLSVSDAQLDQPDQVQFNAAWQPLVPIGDPPIFTTGGWTPLNPPATFSLGNLQYIEKYINETSTQAALNLKVPFSQWNDREGYLKFGGFYDNVARTFDQNSFILDPSGPLFGQGYQAGWDEPWSDVFPFEDQPAYAGPPYPDVDYDGSQLITAWYSMVDLPFNDTMNLVTGFRVETTSIATTLYGEPGALILNPVTGGTLSTSGDTNYNQDNLLPMIGWNWNIREDLVMRTSFAQTVARQTFRELTPILQQEYAAGPIFIGNPDLAMSDLNNYDLRLDWTPFEKWLLSGSVFYKQISDNIEYIGRYGTGFQYTTPVNFDSATLFGLEGEVRVGMEQIIGEQFKGLAVGANATYLDSQTDLPEDLASQFEAFGSPVGSRPMIQTPEYLLNASVTYEFEEWGTQFGVFWTYKGDTLISGASTNGGGGSPPTAITPDIYQIPFDTLNVTIQQRIIDGLTLSFAAKNLTNPDIQTVYRIDGTDTLQSTYSAGIDFSLGLTYRIDF
jgi:TonB-dependent receptor